MNTPNETLDRATTNAPAGRRQRWVRPVRSLALLTTGLLAGAFGFGTLNVAQAFKNVPLDVRLSFHTELMKINGVVMQSAMGLAAVSTLVLAILLTRVPRLLAGTASALVLTTFGFTRFGTVPINDQMKVWATGPVPADYAEILLRWDSLNIVRTVTAFAAFVVLLTLVDRTIAANARRVGGANGGSA